MPEDKKLTLTGSYETDDQQALPKARVDIEVTEQVYYGKPCYVIKDPVSLRYYRLRPPEQTIFQLLDGKRNMDDILKVLGARFPNDQYDRQAVMSFLIMLRSAGLLQVPGAANSDYLLKRKKEQTSSIWQKLRQEFLFYRFPLIDPDKLLNWLNRTLGRFLFTRGAALVTLAILAGAVILLLQNIEKLQERQPLLSWMNLLYLGPSLLLIKFIHEFGHGLSCKHFGHEVHEMGVMFLVFTPCFYCDVSDSWMIPSKGRRMWITAAGIVVEMMLAAMACYVWALTQGGTIINQFALNFMLVGSINTLVFNGNPLLRYDGYYFMMDLVEIPNLKQKGTQYLWYLFQKYVLGEKEVEPPIDAPGREAALLGYALASGVYRWFIMFAITMMIWQFLDPYGWGVIGGIMAVGCIINAFIAPLIKFAKYVFTKRHKLQIRLATALILAAVILGTIYGVLIQKVELSIETQCVLRPLDLHPLYVTQPGFIDPSRNQTLVKDGSMVQAGQVLLQLSEPELEQKYASLRQEVLQLETRRDYLKQMNQPSELAQILAELKGKQQILESLQKKVDQLTIRAPIAGRVQVRTDKPLENLAGAWLPMASALFSVYPPERFEAVAAVSASDNGLIKEGDEVKIKLWALDAEELTAKVERKPPSRVLRLSNPAFSTLFGGEVPVLPAADNKQALTPAKGTYEYELPLATNPQLREGMVGRAKFIIEEKTLAKASYLWLIRTLRLDLRL